MLMEGIDWCDDLSCVNVGIVLCFPKTYSRGSAKGGLHGHLMVFGSRGQILTKNVRAFVTVRY